MYHPRIIERTLDGFANKYGWRPHPHTIGEVEEFVSLVGSILTTRTNTRDTFYSFRDGLRLNQNKRDYIRRWVINEQFYCFADASYFQTRYAYICGVGDDIFRYTPRDSQTIFHRIVAEFDLQQVAIELFVLKARQLGVSTEVALKFLHRILFRSNTRAVMASVQQKQSDLLNRILDTCWNRLPFWLVPPKTVVKTSTPEWANGSIMSIQSGSQSMGIAQGWSPSCIHISEIGDIPRPQKVLEEGLFRAAHSTRNLFFVLEGTGAGDTGWQAEKWKDYKANWGKGGRFCPVFIPPACARDLYPLPDWLKKNPIPESWHPSEETRRMQRKAELYIRSTEYLYRVMGENWRMSREFQWYWEANYREAVASHTEKVWLAQMPCTDEEALQNKFDKAVSDETIEIATRDSEKKYIAYAITGKTILFGSSNKPYEPPKDEIDYAEPRINIHWAAPDGNFYDWELVPLKPFNDADDLKCFDKLMVYQFPKQNVDYSVGVDTADGLGMPNEDRSCLSVWINRTGRERDEQAAEFVSNQVNAPQMARIAACVGAWYGEHAKNPMGCKFAIEQRRKPGDECQHQLKIMGFYHHHQMIMYDGKGVPDPSSASKEGFFTNVWSRPMMLNKFLDALNTGWAKPNSSMLIRQLAELIRKERDGISRIDHDSGKHDDNVFAAGMAWFTAHDMENTALRQERRYRREEERFSQIDLRWATNEVVLE